MKLLVAIVLGCCSLSTLAASTLVSNAEITKIANTGNGSDNFYVHVSGGVGPCTDAAILFPRAAALNEQYLSRAFSIAMMAYASSAKVQITSFEGTDCYKGSLIEMMK